MEFVSLFELKILQYILLYAVTHISSNDHAAKLVDDEYVQL